MTDEKLLELWRSLPSDHVHLDDVIVQFGRLVEQEQATKVVFVDQWACKHTLTVEAAENELKAFYDEWPGGLEEIESALRTATCAQQDKK